MILQIRGQKLDEYVIYAVIDMIDGASIEAQAIILVNQWEHQSTRTSVDSLQKQIKISETIVDVFAIQRKSDIETHSSASLLKTRPSVVICTAELYPQLIQENVIRIKDVRILICDRVRVCDAKLEIGGIDPGTFASTPRMPSCLCLPYRY